MLRVSTTPMEKENAVRQKRVSALLHCIDRSIRQITEVSQYQAREVKNVYQMTFSLISLPVRCKNYSARLFPWFIIRMLSLFLPSFVLPNMHPICCGDLWESAAFGRMGCRGRGVRQARAEVWIGSSDSDWAPQLGSCRIPDFIGRTLQKL